MKSKFKSNKNQKSKKKNKLENKGESVDVKKSLLNGNRTLFFKIEKKKPALVEFFISDIQIPYQDDLALEIVFYLIDKEKPNLLYLGGDIVDMNALTTYHLTDPMQRNIQIEIEEYEKFMKTLRKIFKGKIIYHIGNHERRLRNYLFRKAERLAPLFLSRLSFAEILSASKYNIEIVEGIWRIGKLYHLHGDEQKFKGQIVHLALNMFRRLQRSCIFGHYHRFDIFIQSEVGGTIKGAFANGCLFNIFKMPLPYEFVDLAQKGFSIVRYDENGNYDVEQIKFIPFRKKGNGSIEFDEGGLDLKKVNMEKEKEKAEKDKSKNSNSIKLVFDKGKIDGYLVRFKEDFLVFAY